MVRYISDKQLSIGEFKTPFQAKLSLQNRWVILSQVVPWDEFVSAYMTMMNNGFGVADQYFTYPTDNGILNESRKKCEKMIDKLYETDGKHGG